MPAFKRARLAQSQQTVFTDAGVPGAQGGTIGRFPFSRQPQCPHCHQPPCP
jgi:hypothetical protein